MTDPDRARATEKGRYYDPPAGSAAHGEALVSVTNALSTGFSKYGLPKWYANNAADYALDNLPEVVVRSRRERDAVRADIAGAAERARDSAAGLGTLVHSLAEAHLLGAPAPAPNLDNIELWGVNPDPAKVDALYAEAGLYVAQYLKFLKDFDVQLDRDVVAAEMTVAHPREHYAGTLDAIVKLGVCVEWTAAAPKVYRPEADPRIPGSERVPVLYDIKTSRKRAATQTYPDHILQLAALRHAKEAWIRTADGGYTIGEVPGVAMAAVLNLRPTSYALIPLPADLVAFRKFLNVVDNARWLYEQYPGEYDYRPVLPSGRFKPKRGTKADPSDPSTQEQ